MAGEAKKTSLEKAGWKPGKPLLAGSYGIRVAQGLALASGMHTCLHFPEQAALPLREREREGGERGRREDSARTCTVAPCPCLRG